MIMLFYAFMLLYTDMLLWRIFKIIDKVYTGLRSEKNLLIQDK